MQDLETKLLLDCAKIKGVDLHLEVTHLIDDAITNAADTCIEDGLPRESEAWNARFVEMFKASLEGLVTDKAVSNAARRWFAKRGIVG